MFRADIFFEGYFLSEQDYIYLYLFKCFSDSAVFVNFL